MPEGQSEIKTPQHLDEITPVWMTHALHEAGLALSARVTSLDTNRIGEGKGYLSSVARVAMKFDHDDHDGPDSVVVKIEPESGDLRDLGEEMHAFEREIRFYREVGFDAPLRLPRIYYAQVEPPDFAIMMEDLTYCEPGDQVAGMHESQVLATVRQIARLQAKYWNNSALEALAWMPDRFDIVDHYLDFWPSFVQKCSDLVSPEGIELGHRLAAAFDWVQEQLATAPRTLVHYDLREDNLLFGPAGTPEEVVIVDWQLTMRGLGAFDVASLMGGSELASERCGHQADVAKCWHQTLIDSGLDGYTYDEAWFHFRLASLIALCVPVRYHQVCLDAPLERARDLLRVQSRRTFDSAVEIEAGCILP